MLMSMTLILTILTIWLKHPLSMGLILMMQSILIAFITGLLNYNFWYSYIMFIIMVGGMLVLFIYMTSIASNEKFKTSNYMNILIGLLGMISMLIIVSIDQFNNNMLTKNQDIMTINTMNKFYLSINKYMNFPSNLLMMFMIIYLFITLIAVVKITNISYGPLRQKF